MERTKEYMAKIVADALDREVILDANIRITRQGKKLKAYCEQTGTYLQFPRALREAHMTFVADIVKSPRKDSVPYYRAYPNSIRYKKDGEVIA